MSQQDIKSLKVGVVFSRFNTPVVKEILSSCIEQLIFKGINKVHPIFPKHKNEQSMNWDPYILIDIVITKQ